eukprot:243612_1
MSYRSDRFCTKQNKSNNVSVKNKEYSFGFVFDYPYNEDSIEENEDDGYHNSYCLESETLFGTHDEEQWQWERYYIGNITPKYNNLKQEMISNHVDTITIVQFQIEYQKSEIHYNSVHCVNNIRNDPLFWPNNYSTKNTHYYYRRRNLTIQDILSVMLYCNFTVLQYEFSKTYRMIKINESKNDIKLRHENFYWLGKLLKECVNWFGQRPIYEEANKLYHGIGEELDFPVTAEGFRGIKMYGPISTSCSLHAALNFTNNNIGL